MQYFHSLDVSKIKNYLIFLDIDGTLTNDGSDEVSKEVFDQIQKLKIDNKIYLCSNKKLFDRDALLADKIGVEKIQTLVKKPSRKLLDFVKNSKKLSYLVIGDKIFPDYFFAKNINAKFIKVKRIKFKKEKILIKLSYFFDDIISLFFPDKI